MGYSDTPEHFDYSFDGYAQILDGFVRALGVERFVLYLHDFGSPIGARLAIMQPERILAQIIQNGDIPYEDALGDKYAEIEQSWSLPEPEMRRRREIAIDLIAGLKANRSWFGEHRRYLREHRPPTLIVWGPQDYYMPEKSARAYLGDLPEAELHLLDGGHWLLETNLDEVTLLIRDFLDRTLR
jgi:pimeloyl-ACP methyl ester carboxylesterase